ncbi:acyl-CoA thioesterase [Nioella nitratireducens]|uniref:acyl-CoA thioesterase n=1 Tax=Nioella nitratireducens TaxID=1287720 RepID=UPI0008FD71F6|nr:thioesterase family protein [Nioella nitratireducens]
MAFSFPQKVLFKHCDPAGIVFYPRYFEMINDCVEAFFAEAMGWPFEEILTSKGIPTAEISTRFQSPSHHGDHLTLSLSVTRVGGRSVGLAVVARAGDETRFTAASTLVLVDGAGRPTAWPDTIRQKFLSLQEGPDHAP